MNDKFIKKTLAIAGALVLVGGGCLGGGPTVDAPAETPTFEKEASNAGEQADIIVDSLIDGALEEESALGDGSEDAALLESDDQEFSNFGDYDQNEF